MVRRLAPDPGEFDDTELADDVLTLVRLGRATADKTTIPTRRRLAPVLLPAAAVAVVALIVFSMILFRTDDSDGFRVRSGSVVEEDRWVSLEIFRTTEGGYEPVEAAIHPDDALAFAYTNRFPERLGYLMVFGVDEGGGIYWYYPAHLREGENPSSIRLGMSPQRAELPEEIRHRLRPGLIRVVALFSAEALDVNAVEKSVARGLAKAGSLQALARLELEGTGQQSFLLTVHETR
jgi:hypothetical protein